MIVVFDERKVRYTCRHDMDQIEPSEVPVFDKEPGSKGRLRWALGENPLAQKGTNRKMGAFQRWGADTLGRLQPSGVRFIDGNNVDAVGGNGSSSMTRQYRRVRQDILRHCFAQSQPGFQLFLKLCQRPSLVCLASGITDASVADWNGEYEGDDIEDEGDDED